MFKVGQRVKVLGKTIGIPKEESQAWKELNMADMIGVIKKVGIYGDEFNISADGEGLTTIAVFSDLDIAPLVELGEVEEL